MSQKIQLNRGLAANLPTLDTGEPGWTTDDEKLYIGNPSGNILINPDNLSSVENGFEDRADSTISFVDGTRTFTITPTGASFIFYSGEEKFIKSSAESIVISDTDGLHYIYYDTNGNLTETTTWNSDTLILRDAFVAVVGWDTDHSSSTIVADERHGRMNAEAHIYLHEVFHSQWVSGLGFGDIITNGSGDLDTHAQISVSNGVFRDEDIRHIITGGSPQVLAAPAQIPVFYRDGTSGKWHKSAATDFPCTKGTSTLYWNENTTGTTWTRTEVTNNDFVLYHIFATGDIANPIISVMGQAMYTNRNTAESSATTEIKNILFGDLASIVPEMLPLGTLIFQTGTGKSNAVAASIEETDDGSDYIDWRFSSTAAGGISGGTTSWGEIVGTLSDQIDLQSALDLKLENVVEDIRPLLGGDLYTNGSSIWVEVGDNIIFGGEDGLSIDHNGVDAYITNGTGNLYQASDALTLRSATGLETYLTATLNGAVDVYYDNALKFSTSSAGVTITGTLNATVDVTVGGASVALDTDLHAESHTIASHSDTTATGSEIEELTDGSETTLHSHAGTDLTTTKYEQFLVLESSTGNNVSLVDVDATYAGLMTPDMLSTLNSIDHLFSGYSEAADPDTFTAGIRLTQHTNCPVSGYEFYIQTFEFDATISANSHSFQIAYSGNNLFGTIYYRVKTSTTWYPWKAAVDTTNAQSIAGVKTFSSFPVGPSSAPTTDYQLANKKYVDDNSGSYSRTALVAPGAYSDSDVINWSASYNLTDYAYLEVEYSMNVAADYYGSKSAFIPTDEAISDGYGLVGYFPNATLAKYAMIYLSSLTANGCTVKISETGTSWIESEIRGFYGVNF